MTTVPLRVFLLCGWTSHTRLARVRLRKIGTLTLSVPIFVHEHALPDVLVLGRAETEEADTEIVAVSPKDLLPCTKSRRVFRIVVDIRRESRTSDKSAILGETTASRVTIDTKLYSLLDQAPDRCLGWHLDTEQKPSENWPVFEAFVVDKFLQQDDQVSIVLEPAGEKEEITMTINGEEFEDRNFNRMAYDWTVTKLLLTSIDRFALQNCHSSRFEKLLLKDDIIPPIYQEYCLTHVPPVTEEKKSNVSQLTREFRLGCYIGVKEWTGTLANSTLNHQAQNWGVAREPPSEYLDWNKFGLKYLFTRIVGYAHSDSDHLQKSEKNHSSAAEHIWRRQLFWSEVDGDLRMQSPSMSKDDRVRFWLGLSHLRPL